MKFITILLLTIGICHAQSNYVYIDQVGDSNQITINQDGNGHVAGVAIGSTLPTNNNDLKTGYGIGTRPVYSSSMNEFNTVNITQQGIGTKTATVEMPSASFNTAYIFQDGTGNHKASIQNLTGTNNNININQYGSGNHEFNIVNTPNTTNSNNIIAATQSGEVGADKTFNLTLSGTTGATVAVQQTNPTQGNTGAMTIQCNPCGAYSYIRQ